MSGQKLIQKAQDSHWLTTLYRPVMDLHTGQLVGHAGRACGPSDSEYADSDVLRRAACSKGVGLQMESICLVALINRFVAAEVKGLLFVRIGVDALLAGVLTDSPLKKLLSRQHGLRNRIILQLTDSVRDAALDDVVDLLRELRNRGYHFALDDVMTGRAGLQLWLASRPDYVWLGASLTAEAGTDNVAYHFLRSLRQIGERSQTRLVATGIDSKANLNAMKRAGVCLGLGDHIGKERDLPEGKASHGAWLAASSADVAAEYSRHYLMRAQTAQSLLVEAVTVSVNTLSETALQILLANPELNALPVLDGRRPVGLINRTMVDKFSTGFSRELYGRKSCVIFMNPDPLVVEADTPLVMLSQMVLSQGIDRFGDGFILVRQGEYAGIGSNFGLMQEMTRQQIEEARYANPLTLLPGNVPISEHMQYLLDTKQPFHAAYADLDHFKPFNDVFGYRRGDDIIKLTARILLEHTDPQHDFVGHIGGDDFFVLFTGHLWEEACRRMLSAFDEGIRAFLQQENLAGASYEAEDRRGNHMTFTFPTLSIGVVPVNGQYHESHEVAAVAADVKKAAKQRPGSSLYVDQRIRPSVAVGSVLQLPDLPTTAQSGVVGTTTGGHVVAGEGVADTIL